MWEIKQSRIVKKVWDLPMDFKKVWDSVKKVWDLN